MELFKYIGMVAVAVGTFGLLTIVYQIAKGFVLACDFIMWQYTIAKQSKPDVKFELGTFFKGVMENWVDLICYDPANSSYNIGSSTWKGFRSWK